jgi:hypothetical protein
MYNMATEKVTRSKWLKIRLTPAELISVHRRYKRTSCQNMSEFGRSMIMGKPVTVLNRDRSMDDILEELITLRRELNAIGNNLNQAVRNINSLHGLPDARLWSSLLQLVKSQLEPHIESIKKRMDNYADLWLQRSKAAKA